ncbi:hypothetical protein NQ317_009150 [Molorchus minor]|uniref:ZAD domain-containing protein n=1 Tax=Molorchus minor TaxID=1323400 RepID=A0ABQ9K0B5_9CUCU|nr:hypothetical protein NQ317_009150 [Molorchus minor]
MIFELKGMDLSLPKTPLMCITCSRIVKKSFHFKAICLSTEEKISCLADAKQVTVVDMRQLYLMENSISDTQSYKNYNVCRFCMISLENHCFVKLNSLMDDIGLAEKCWENAFLKRILYKSKNQHDMKLHTDIEHRENPLEDVSILIYRLPKEPLETTTIL